MAIHTLRFATLRLMLVILLSFAFGIAASAAPKGGGSRFVLVIDAGHGGKDNGASGRISKEKNINLSVALAFGRLVENNCPDVKVIYTRKSDVFVTLQGRADIANRNKANLFVSIHTNSMPPGVTAPTGTETYTVGMHSGKENLAVAKRENSVITQEANYRTVYKNFDPNKSESYIIFEFMQDRNMKQSVEFARHIQSAYGDQGRKNKGVHQAGFLVLRATAMPSVLTEVGFISNPEEERFLNSKEGVQKLAHALYQGFCAYRRRAYAAHDPVEADESHATDRQMAAVRDEVNDATPVRVPPVGENFAATTVEARVVPIATRPFGVGKRPVMNPSPNRQPPTVLVVPSPPISRETAAVRPAADRPKPTTKAEEHVIPLLADAVPPAHPTQNATTTAPNGRTATATDAGLHRIDTVRERSAAGSTTEIVTVLATDGGARQAAAQMQPPVNEKPLTIVVIPSDVARRAAADALAAAQAPVRPAEPPAEKAVVPIEVKTTPAPSHKAAPAPAPSPTRGPAVPDATSTKPKSAQSHRAEPPMASAAKPTASAQTKTKEAKKAQEKGADEKKAEPRAHSRDKETSKAETKSGKADTKGTKPEAQSATPEAKPTKKEKTAPASAATASRITFKVQLFTSDKQLASNDARLKGLSPVSFYHIGPLYRYTYGSSHDYAEIKKTLKKVTPQFPNAFIVAFDGDKRVDDLQAAIRQSQAK